MRISPPVRFASTFPFAYSARYGGGSMPRPKRMDRTTVLFPLPCGPMLSVIPSANSTRFPSNAPPRNSAHRVASTPAIGGAALPASAPVVFARRLRSGDRHEADGRVALQRLEDLREDLLHE